MSDPQESKAVPRVTVRGTPVQTESLVSPDFLDDDELAVLIAQAQAAALARGDKLLYDLLTAQVLEDTP